MAAAKGSRRTERRVPLRMSIRDCTWLGLKRPAVLKNDPRRGLSCRRLPCQMQNPIEAGVATKGSSIDAHYG